VSVALALAALALGAGTDERPFPAVPLVDFTGTEARALDDFLGQPVLVDFFAHWCAPCARLVPHLSELHDAFGAQGLNVLGVTGDDAATPQEWLARHGGSYPHARDATLALQIELGFRPLPFAVLVDATGVIVWSGNPGELAPERIEAVLADALPEPALRWSAAAQPVRVSLRARRYGEALGHAKGAAELARFVERFVARRGELLEAALAAGDLLGAEELAAELETGLADGPLRARATEVRARLATDPAAGPLLAAQRALRELWSGVGAVATVKAADELAEKVRALGAAHPDSAVARASTRHLATLEALKTVLP
jgi:thiol-disulfide isomerase/thioredoxin